MVMTFDYRNGIGAYFDMTKHFKGVRSLWREKDNSWSIDFTTGESVTLDKDYNLKSVAREEEDM